MSHISARPATRKLKAMLLSLGVAGLAVAVPVLSAAPASAVTCSGASCNGLDPEATGCSVGAVTHASAQIYDAQFGVSVGTVDIRWSPTCKTNWGRATMSMWTENVADWKVSVVLQDGSQLEYEMSGRLQSGSVIWSGMLYAPVQYAYARSWVFFSDPATGVKRFPEGRTVWAG